MSIASAIVTKQQQVADAYTAISNKGGTLPATQNLTNLPTAINSVSSADSVTATNNSSSAVSNGDKVWIHEVNEAPSASIGTKTTSPMSTASYDVTILGSNGNGVVNGYLSGASYPYEVSNNLNTFTQGSTAVSSAPSSKMTFVGENICLMNSGTGQPQLYDGSTVTDLQNYVGGWQISGSNGEYVVYTNSNSNTFRRIVSLSDGSYVDCTGPNIGTSQAVYDKNTGKLYSIASSYCLTFDKENGSYTYSNITVSGGSDGYCEKPALTSDGKYIIPQRYYGENPQYMNSYVLKLFKISGNTYTLVTDDVFGQWLSTGCDVFYNPNCDVLVCTNRNTGQCGFFKYTPATEMWSEISVDLSSIATFTNFQAPIQVNNQNNQMMIKTGNSGGDYRTNGGKIYLANYTVSAGGLVWKIQDFYSPVCYNFGFASDGSGVFPSIDSEYKASNFSSSRYITYPAFIRNRSKATYYHKLYTGSVSSSAACVYEYNLFDALYIDNGNLRTYNWSSGQNVIILSNISSNTIYYIKVVVDLPKREYYYSTDGVTYVKAVEVSDTSMVAADLPAFVGRNYSGSTYFYFSGSYIDLSGEYVEDENGNVIWKALNVPNITQDTYSGIAQENIAVNAEGDVKICL